MRLTINLDDELYAMARAHAIASKMSISKAVADLLRRKTAPNRHFPALSEGRDPLSVHPLSGFPVVAGDASSFSSKDVHQAEEDNELRHWSPTSRSKPTRKQ